MRQYARMIKQRRRELGLTQKELAKMIPSSQQAIARFEAGKSEPNIGMLEALSDALGVPVSYFIDQETTDAESQYIALYRSLSKENQRKAIEFLSLLKRQETEQEQIVNKALNSNTIDVSTLKKLLSDQPKVMDISKFMDFPVNNQTKDE